MISTQSISNRPSTYPRAANAWRPMCVCVNSTSRGERSLATPAYQGKLTLVFLPLGAAVNRIKSATLTLPSAQGRPLARLHPTFPKRKCSTNTQSRTKFSPRLCPRQVQGPRGPAQGGASPSLSPNLNPSADPTKTVGSANPSFSPLPHRVPRLVNLR